MNKINLPICIIILGFVIYGCRESSQHIKIITEPRYTAQKLQGESLNLFDTLSNPGRIYYCDSLLFLLENKKDRKMIICDPYRESIVNELIPTGRGPGEQIGTFYFGYNQDNRNIYAFDITLRQALSVHRDSVFMSGYSPKTTYRYHDIYTLGTDVIDDTTFIAVGFYDDCRVVKFTPGGVLNKLGGSPDLKRPINSIINQAYTGMIKVSPEKDKFVIACLHADQLEIFSLKNSEKVLFVKGPESLEPSYRTKQVGQYNVLIHNKDEKFCYLDLYVTKEHIYVLFSGKSFFSEKSGYGNTIRVFSWEGEYLYDYILSKEINAFTYDEISMTFYGIASEPGAEIYRFKII